MHDNVNYNGPMEAAFTPLHLPSVLHMRGPWHGGGVHWPSRDRPDRDKSTPDCRLM